MILFLPAPIAEKGALISLFQPPPIKVFAALSSILFPCPAPIVAFIALTVLNCPAPIVEFELLMVFLLPPAMTVLQESKVIASEGKMPPFTASNLLKQLPLLKKIRRLLQLCPSGHTP
jgi:hypothetical protein